MARIHRAFLWGFIFPISLLLLPAASPHHSHAAQPGVSEASQQPTVPTEFVILFVLEGIGQDSLQGGSMPVLNQLVTQGATTWSATGVNPPLRLPTMASIVTGMPVEKHGITWNTFEFNRGYPRPPTLFDYLDLSGGRDSAIFFMDEALYQLAKPEPYTDYQMCGPLKPECNPGRVVAYVRQYMEKAMSGDGYGHAILALPHLLVVHLPAAGRAGDESGWKSPAYREALTSVDKAMGAILDFYREHELFDRTTVFVTSISGPGQMTDGVEGRAGKSLPHVPWIASGVGIKAGHTIRQPVSVIDIGATVMRTLGLETHVEWDSKAVQEIFTTAAVPQPSAKN